MIFHHFRLGSFDLVSGLAELNVQYMYLQHFCTFAFFLHFSLESFDLVGGIGGYNVQFVFSAALYCSIFTLLHFQHFCLDSCDLCGGGGYNGQFLLLVALYF